VLGSLAPGVQDLSKSWEGGSRQREQLCAKPGAHEFLEASPGPRKEGL
jgi:hypothetical protein